MFRLRKSVSTLALACSFSFSTSTVLALESVELETLMELDLFDWSSIHPQQVIQDCTMTLKNKTKLNESQIYRLYLLRAIRLYLLGKESVAVTDLTEALTLRPNDLLALLNRGKCYYALRQYDKARMDFEALIKHHPKSALGYACLASCIEKIGDVETIKKLGEKAIKLDPSEPMGYLVRAGSYLHERNYGQAFDDLDKCIKLRYGDGTMQAAHPYVVKAIFRLDVFDNPKKAHPDLLMARAINPNDDVIKGLFCAYYFKIGRYKLAFHISEQLPKERTDVLGRRIHCLIEHRRCNEALRIAEGSLLRRPLKWAGYLYRGEAFFSKGDYKEALQDYDKCLELSTHDGVIEALAAKAYMLAACPYKQYRDGRAAQRLATKCCERTEYKTPRHLMLLAMACAECGDYNEAVCWANKSLEQAEQNFPFLEDYKKRLSLFESKKAYRFSPDNPVIDYLYP